jgi:membrane-bound lytic murein transglycosylase D
MVQAGDTLYAISRKYNVSVEELRRWNRLNNESILNVGQVIIIKK